MTLRKRVRARKRVGEDEKIEMMIHERSKWR